MRINAVVRTFASTVQRLIVATMANAQSDDIAAEGAHGNQVANYAKNYKNLLTYIHLHGLPARMLFD